MRLGLLLYTSLVSGSFYTGRSHTNNVLNLNEFLDLTDTLAERTLTTVSTVPNTCDANLNIDPNGNTPCFVLDANRMDPYKLRQALYLVEGEINKVNRFIDEGVDEVKVILSKNPECKIIRYDLEKLAKTQAGPGSIMISHTDAEKLKKNWQKNGKVQFKVPFEKIIGNFTIPISADLSKSIETSTSSTVGISYDIPSGTSCTPHVIRLSVMCNVVQSHAYYFKDQKLIFDRGSPLHPNSPVSQLIPVNHYTKSYFKTVNGCIDFSR